MGGGGRWKFSLAGSLGSLKKVLGDLWINCLRIGSRVLGANTLS